MEKSVIGTGETSVLKTQSKEGDNLVINVDSPSKLLVETLGGTKLECLVTPNNPAKVHVGSDLINIEVTVLQRSDELREIKT
jgi:hypothetical protein